MKSIRFIFIILVLTFFSSKIIAHQWEIGFKIVNNGQPDTNFTVKIYGFNESTGNYDPLIDVMHNKWFDGDINIICDQRTYNGDIYTPTYYTPAYPVVPYANQYLFRFGDNCVIYKVDPTKFNEDVAGDWSVTYDISTGIISEGPSNNGSMWEWEGTTSWNDTFTFTLKNDFNAGFIAFRSVSYYSGTQLTMQESSFPNYIYASSHNQIVNEYKRYFKSWSAPGHYSSYAGFDLEKTYLTTNPSLNNVIAAFDKECNLVFQTYSKPFTADGINYSSDQTLYKIAGDAFTAVASDTNYNDVAYTFLYWKKMVQ